MAKGREKSDDRVVPKAPRKNGESAAVEQCGGKAVTANEQAKQLEMFGETADSPQGADGGADEGQPLPVPRAVPKSPNKTRDAVPAMTMEEIANRGNLTSAFRQVASNKGAPGPDRQSVEEVHKHLGDVLSALRSELLDGSYRPGQIRRVWIPKSNGGQRGLGIPNVIDRIAQQAVQQVLSPYYETTFHASSHGFRPGRIDALLEDCASRGGPEAERRDSRRALAFDLDGHRRSRAARDSRRRGARLRR